MELERTRFPTPFPDTDTPAGLLKAMVLASPGAVPPTVLLDASKINTPSPPLPREPVPFLSVPMRLPSTLLLVTVGPTREVNGSTIETPAPKLPERTLRAAEVVPPTVLLVGSLRPLRALISTPLLVLGLAVVPEA